MFRMFSLHFVLEWHGMEHGYWNVKQYSCKMIIPILFSTQNEKAMQKAKQIHGTPQCYWITGLLWKGIEFNKQIEIIILQMRMFHYLMQWMHSDYYAIKNVEKSDVRFHSLTIDNIIRLESHLQMCRYPESK